MSLAHEPPDQVDRFLAAQPISVQLFRLSGPALTEWFIEILRTDVHGPVGLAIIAVGRPLAVAELVAALSEESPPSVDSGSTPPPANPPRRPRTGAGHDAPAGGDALHGGWDRLTEREKAIADLAGQGLTNQQIANRLFVSPHTVNYHLRQIFRKLRIRSRVHLARVVPRCPAEQQ